LRSLALIFSHAPPVMPGDKDSGDGQQVVGELALAAGRSVFTENHDGHAVGFAKRLE
jgi:hypothetical protein